jgi:DHA1 family bicyclomycin/chloramphenicol resistance-like MFS transporter
MRRGRRCCGASRDLAGGGQRRGGSAEQAPRSREGQDGNTPSGDLGLRDGPRARVRRLSGRPGPADAADPRGPTLIVLLGLLTAFGPMSIDMYLPSLPTIRAELGGSTSSVQLTLSAFTIGFAAGQLFYGPLSDRLGRRPVVLVGILLFIAASVLCASSPGIDALIASRCLQAFGGGAGSALARAIVPDLYQHEAASRVLSLMMLVMLLAPLLAPLVGGQILVHVGWRAIFWALALFGMVCLAAALRHLPETLAPENRRGAGIGAVLSGYGEVLSHRRTLGCAILGGMSFAGLFTFLSLSPFVYIDVFGVAPEHYGLLFAVNAVGVMIGAYANSRLVGRLGVERMLRLGVTWSALAGVALVMLVAFGSGGLAAIVAGTALFLLPHSITNANALTLALEPFARLAGTASSAIGAIRFGSGALAGALVGWLHDGTALPMALGIGLAGLGALAAYWAMCRA